MGRRRGRDHRLLAPAAGLSDGPRARRQGARDRPTAVPGGRAGRPRCPRGSPGSSARSSPSARDGLERVAVAELERVVGAEQDVLGADVLDEPAQQRRGEHRGVVVEPVGELARRHRRSCGRRPCAPSPCPADRAATAGSRRRGPGTGSAGTAPAPGRTPAGRPRARSPSGSRRAAAARSRACRCGSAPRWGAGRRTSARSDSSAHRSSLTGSSRSRPPPRLPIAMPAMPELVEGPAGLLGRTRPARAGPSRARAAGPARRRRRWRARRCPAPRCRWRSGSSSAVEQNRNGGSETACRSHADVVHLGQSDVHVVLRAGQRAAGRAARPRSPAGRAGRCRRRTPPRSARPRSAEPLQQRERHRVRVHVECAALGRVAAAAARPLRTVDPHRVTPRRPGAARPTVVGARGPATTSSHWSEDGRWQRCVHRPRRANLRRDGEEDGDEPLPAAPVRLRLGPGRRGEQRGRRRRPGRLRRVDATS